MTLQNNLQYGYERGWAFTPLNGKRPINNGWQKASRGSLEQTLKYAESNNMGLRCGNISAPEGKYLIVIDQDEGGDVTPLNLPSTVTVTTGKGRHYYFYSNQPAKNSAGKLGEHIDTRGEGGQVVYPGSVHPETGVVYDWMPGHSPQDIAVADLPAHIVTQLTDKHLPSPPSKSKPRTSKNQRYAMAALQYECNNVREAVEGTRNDILNTAAFKLGTLVAVGHLNAADAESGLLAAALAVGLKKRESKATIQSGLTSGKKNPRKKREQKKSEPTQRAAENRPWFCTDLGNAERLVHYEGDTIRYCHPIGQWLIWRENRWQSDDNGKIGRKTISTIKSIWDEAYAATEEDTRELLTAWAIKSQNRSQISSMIHVARSIQPIPILPSQLDQNIYLFNCKNGTVNLLTGKLQDHDPSDHITKLAPLDYNANAECPLWLNFLDRIMEGNPDLINFLQRLAGYCLSGDISEQVFPIFYGSGANGKSVFIDTLTGIMGPYAQVAPTSLLMESNQSQHATDVAMLMGKRLVQCSETEEGKRLKISLVKQITGDKRLTARFMRQDNFQFDVTHKILMVTNHRPAIKEDSEGIWRRIRLVPFNARITSEERDPHLYEKLQDEWPGILAWAIKGFQEWQDEGLGLPMEIALATESYRDDFDLIGEFLEACCEPWNLETQSTPVTEMRNAYLKWAEQTGSKYPLGPHTFNERLEARGYKRQSVRIDNKVVKCWQGIVLKLENYVD